jgi:hypothetical protein
MTPVEMETLLHDIDRRLTRVEHALPVIAADLRFELAKSALTLRAEMAETAARLEERLVARIDQTLTARFGQTDHGLRVLIEGLRGDNQVMAEHILTVPSRLPPQ